MDLHSGEQGVSDFRFVGIADPGQVVNAVDRAQNQAFAGPRT